MRTQAPSAKKQMPRSSAKPRLRSKAKALRILVVENHPSTRRGLEVFLEMLGHEARYAEDVKTALSEAGCDGPFDVLLSDINLPDGDGWNLLRELHHRGQCPPHAVAMSGFGSLNDLEKSQAAGFRQHLIKPFPPEVLEAALLGGAMAKASA